MDLSALHPDPALLLAAVVIDLIAGDPVYRMHPVRLMGATLTTVENALRRFGWSGRTGGIALVLVLAGLWTGGAAALGSWTAAVHPWAGWGFHVFLLWHMIALGDLLKHGREVDSAAGAGDVEGSQRAIGKLAGRDTDRMDAAACRRAAVESLAESIVDGYISVIFWYALLGLPGAVLFKVVSTMDSMVGNKTPRYLYFGWAGARLDDVMNFVPARITYVLMGIAALVIPGCSAGGAWRVGWRQHAVVPGPNAGWSEATAAGALGCRLIGPVWLRGRLVTDVWIGASGDPECGRDGDIRKASMLVSLTAGLFAAAASGWIWGVQG